MERLRATVDPEFQHIREGLDFCVQVTKVSSASSFQSIVVPLTRWKGLAFLHRHLVAHVVRPKFTSDLRLLIAPRPKDVAEENILMNFLDIEQTDIRGARVLRSRFPVQHGFINFGQSRKFAADDIPHLADVCGCRSAE